MEADESLVQQAKNSDPSAFKTVYDEKALDLLIDQRERSEELFNTLVGNDAAREFLFDKMREAFLRRLSATTQISTIGLTQNQNLRGHHTAPFFTDAAIAE